MSQFNFDRVRTNMERLKVTLPVKIANQAQKYFTNSFKTQSFDKKVWPQVKRRIPGTPEYMYPKNRGLQRRTKPINVKTGRLRRAVSASKRRVTFEKITFVVDVPYAAFVNEGTRRMPARPFIGNSKELKEQQKKLIDTEYNKAWQV